MFKIINCSELSRINTDELLPSSNSPIFDFDSETLENNLFTTHSFTGFNTQPMLTYVAPSHLNQLPEIEDTPDNDYNFNMDLKFDPSNKSHSLYSPKLSKVYIKMDTPLNVYPTFNAQGLSADKFFIRAMIVYSSQNDLPEPVVKCPNHRAKGSQTNPDHILNCGNRAGVLYVGDPTGKIFSERLAVIINMGSVASNEPLRFEFSCQNSCSGGMNRKLTTLIFTLEDEHQNILGRKSMQFKVCSCPRRDKEKDEESTKVVLPKKRKLEGGNVPSTSAKRISLPRQDSDSVMQMETVTDMSNIKLEPDSPCELKLLVPNENLKKEVLRAAYNIIAGDMTRTGQMAHNCYLTEIQKQIGK